MNALVDGYHHGDEGSDIGEQEGRDKTRQPVAGFLPPGLALRRPSDLLFLCEHVHQFAALLLRISKI
jgi:hypothetical protein